ncbi:MAG: VOC family protein [Actinomycetota bacterium]|nr:VOC family protein [Actinomycetota bacterium]
MTPHQDAAVAAAAGPLPAVLSESALDNAFLGKVVEVCIVTEDHYRTMAGLVRLGIGPFRVYTFDDTNLAAPTYRGEDSPFSLTVCFATNAGLTWEIMQPLSGRTIMREFLDSHGEGIHHLAFDCDGLPWEQRVSQFAVRGFAQTQSGRWRDQNAFSFFDTEAATTTCFETYHFPDDFTLPEPDAWYPGPPPPGTAATPA